MIKTKEYKKMSDLSTYAYHIGRVLKVLVYIEDHLDEPLSLEEMAKIASISPFYFHKLFRIYMGETFAEYIKRLRLQRARERLQYSDAPITEIALDVGYETPSSFTKVFNQVIGQSPSQYRKIMQPIVQMMMKRTLQSSKEKTIPKPEYISRKEESVLFVRRVGDYQETPWKAFDALFQFLEEKRISIEKIKTRYSMALDDPYIVGRAKCRFDACVALKDALPSEGEIGQKTIHGGRFAVFTHIGPYCDLEKTFDDIFLLWYPSSREKLADTIPFSEHLSPFDNSVADESKVTKIYIPLIN